VDIHSEETRASKLFASRLERNVNGHLVVRQSRNPLKAEQTQRVQLDALPSNQDRSNALNAQRVRRRAHLVQEDRMLADKPRPEYPKPRARSFNQLLGPATVEERPFGFKREVDERH